jgi:hypothetical protein
MLAQNAICGHLVAFLDLDQVADNKLCRRDHLDCSRVTINWHNRLFCLLLEITQTMLLNRANHEPQDYNRHTNY